MRVSVATPSDGSERPLIMFLIIEFVLLRSGIRSRTKCHAHRCDEAVSASVRIIRCCDLEEMPVFQIHAGNIRLVLSFSLCHLFKRGNLTEKILLWLGRASEHSRARSRIRNDARLRPYHRTFANPKMPGHRRLASDADIILEHG